jgi:hypothetical protein
VSDVVKGVGVDEGALGSRRRVTNVGHQGHVENTVVEDM